MPIKIGLVKFFLIYGFGSVASSTTNPFVNDMARSQFIVEICRDIAKGLDRFALASMLAQITH